MFMDVMHDFKVGDRLIGQGEEFNVIKIFSFGGDAELKYTGNHKYNLGDIIPVSFKNDSSHELWDVTVISIQDIRESRYTKYTSSEKLEEVITYTILTVTMYDSIERPVHYMNGRRKSNFDETEFLNIRKSLRDSIVKKLNLSKRFYNGIMIDGKKYEDAANDMIFAFNSIRNQSPNKEEKSRINRGMDLFKKFYFTYL